MNTTTLHLFHEVPYTDGYVTTRLVKDAIEGNHWAAGMSDTALVVRSGLLTDDELNELFATELLAKAGVLNIRPDRFDRASNCGDLVVVTASEAEVDACLKAFTRGPLFAMEKWTVKDGKVVQTSRIDV